MLRPILLRSIFRHSTPRCPRQKTPEFWDIVDASRAPEDAELADLLDRMKNPDATTLNRILNAACGGEIEAWLRDRKNRRSLTGLNDAAMCLSATTLRGMDCGKSTTRGKSFTCEASFQFATGFERLIGSPISQKLIQCTWACRCG
jgi:hypothetical protein